MQVLLAGPSFMDLKKIAQNDVGLGAGPCKTVLEDLAAQIFFCVHRGVDPRVVYVGDSRGGISSGNVSFAGNISIYRSQQPPDGRCPSYGFSTSAPVRRISGWI